jgi:hypothetical protein
MANMTCIIALPRHSIAPLDIERRVHMLWHRFSSIGSVILLSNREDDDQYGRVIEKLGLQFEWVNVIPQDVVIEHFVSIYDMHEIKPEFDPPPGTKKIYIIAKDGRLHITNDWLTKELDPFINDHVFNRCNPPTDSPLFAFAPYTYIFRYPGLGKYNQFGHRIDFDHLTLANRDPDHKVIGVFGGSACWSIFCYDNEVFTRRLQEKLNTHCLINGSKYQFTVLNFGLPGNIVLNETITYLLHCQGIRPNIVIGHDGFNDCFYGAISDPKLLQGHSISYQFNIEEWANTIRKDWYESAKQPIDIGCRDHLIQPQWPFKTVNLPQDILLAYCKRKLQFKQMVEGWGGKFIWGIQPYVLSKHHHSKEEESYLSELSNDNTVRDVYRRIPFLYEKLKLMLETYAEESLVDFDSIFSEFTSDETHFADYCHLTPAGDEILAEIYSNYIIDKILPRWINGEK